MQESTQSSIRGTPILAELSLKPIFLTPSSPKSFALDADIKMLQTQASLVSVIIPAYNAQQLIARTLMSVLNQTYRHLEVWVVDDGSRDRTAEIVQAIAKQDDRVRLLQQPNAGVASARNLGIRSAQGEFIALIDSDDLWYPDALGKLVAQFQRSLPAVGVIYAWSVDIDEQDRPIGGFHAAAINGHVYRTLICHNFLGNASATLIRKDCLDRIGGYDTQLKAQKAQGCEDWDLYLRLAEHYEFGVVPEFLIGYRKVASSMSMDFSQMARSQQFMLQSIQKNHPELSGYLYRLSRSSFYLYLAQQCDVYGDARETLGWLWQAIKADPITSMGRLGLYLLLIKNLAKLAGESWQLFRMWTLFMPQRLPIKDLLMNESFSTPIYPLSLPIHPLKIWLKVMVGSFLHQSVSKI